MTILGWGGSITGNTPAFVFITAFCILWCGVLGYKLAQFLRHIARSDDVRLVIPLAALSLFFLIGCLMWLWCLRQYRGVP